jgi:hypothetical protein
MNPRWFWLLLGYGATGCGIAGAVLPLVPTTPFLLVAAYAFARSSPRLHDWLTTHPQFGPLIDDWHRHGAINPKTKRLAVVVMLLTVGASWAFGASGTIIAVQALVLTCSATFILTRPNGPG